MRLCSYYGNNKVVVKYTEGESKVYADNVNVENFLRIGYDVILKLWC